MKTIHNLVKWIAIVLWIIIIAIVAYKIGNHTFWSLAPIIAHNHVQNYLGWLVILAFIFSIATPFLGLFDKKD